jgi:hypothetical protein
MDSDGDKYQITWPSIISILAKLNVIDTHIKYHSLLALYTNFLNKSNK